jgi:hypothetical protein
VRSFATSGNRSGSGTSQSIQRNLRPPALISMSAWACRTSCFCVNTVLMKRQTVITKKRRGPAPTGKGTLVGVRLQPDRLAAVDAWITKQDAPMTRPEAIRAMLDAVLVIVAKDPGEKPAKKAKIP